MSDRDQASTFAKGLAVLECFESGRDDLTMADLARLTGFDRAVVRRLCLTLEASGFVQRAGRFWRLTPKVLAIAGGYLGAERIGRTVQPVLNQCAEELNGEIALAIRSGARAIYVARSAVGSARLSLGLSVGSTLPLLPTAVGRMLLASCDDARREAVVAVCELVKYTPSTDMHLPSIREKIAGIAATGHAYVADEFEQGAAGLAVPLPPISGAEAVLATSLPSAQLARPEQRERLLGSLFSAAQCLR